MITCKLMGGLGNQLFQIFTTIAYAIKTQQTFKFYDIDILESSCTTRYTYWGNFLKSLKPLPWNGLALKQNRQYLHLVVNSSG